MFKLKILYIQLYILFNILYMHTHIESSDLLYNKV